MSEFFTKGMAQDELMEAIRRGNLPDSLKVIGQLQQSIALLQIAYPVSETRAEIIRLLQDCQETVRKAHEAHCTKEMTQ